MCNEKRPDMGGLPDSYRCDSVTIKVHEGVVFRPFDATTEAARTSPPGESGQGDLG